jgi:hypothetical protein
MRRQHNRYAAKLLFQFRVGQRGWARRRLCEERTILFRAASTKLALVAAKRAGKAGQSTYINTDGRRVRFEFVGVLDLLHLGLECRQEEVWYEIKEMMEPMERRKKLLPSDAVLFHRGRTIGVARKHPLPPSEKRSK